MSDCELMRARSPWATTPWSCARRTRVFSAGNMLRELRYAARQCLHMEAAADGLCPLAHHQHAQARAPAVAAVGHRVESDPIIRNRHDVLGAGAAQVDIDLRRARMLRDVVERDR